MIAGIRSDLGIKVYGDDFETLTNISNDIQRVLLSVPGAADVSGEQITGLPMLRIDVDPQALARFRCPDAKRTQYR